MCRICKAIVVRRCCCGRGSWAGSRYPQLRVGFGGGLIRLGFLVVRLFEARPFNVACSGGHGAVLRFLHLKTVVRSVQFCVGLASRAIFTIGNTLQNLFD